jgi:predicted dehydrogenase
MSSRINRRQLLQHAAGAGFWIAGRTAARAADANLETSPSAARIPPSERLNIGFVGVANRGAANLSECAALPNVNVAALCDVDDSYLAEPARRFSKARVYNDFRQMLDKSRELDAVLVATPDHIHAIAAVSAMKAGKHVYCEKPLSRTLHEVRTVTDTAIRLKRVTQMGTQIHAGTNYRRVVELVRAGVIGPIREVHIFCATRWAATQPVTGTPPVPPNLHWDLWLGPTPDRPYNPAYLPATWRRYWAFGSGTLGDMGCHYIDLAFWALDLKYPTRVESDGPPPQTEGCPTWITATWQFPSRGDKPPVKLTWYDGGKRPAQTQEWGLDPKWSNGVVFIGEKGRLFADYGQHKLLPADDFAGFVPPEPTIPNSLGHHREWVEACLRNDPSATTCRFAYSGPLAETVLLGTLAYRLGKPLDWDATTLKATNAPEADTLIHQPYRDGWKL